MMQIYHLTKEASEELKIKAAELFMQQISVSHTEDSFEKAMQAINMTIAPDSQSRLVLAEEDGSLLGLALLNVGISLRIGTRYLWLNELYVKNSFRNKGIGKKILLYIIHWAEHEDIKAIELETGVNNSVTKHIYQSLGFYEIVSKRYGFTF